MKNLKKLVDEFSKSKENFMKETANLLKKEVLQFMEDNPEIEEISWKQYTPYFNDGDACVFNVGEPSFKLKNIPEDAGDYEDGFVSTYEVEDKKLKKILENFCEIFNSNAMEDVLLSAFDDHVRITVGRDGKFEVEEYDHD